MTDLMHAASVVYSAAFLLLSASIPASASPVDDRRLLAAGEEKSSWLTYGRDYSNQRFSPLTQVDAHTVARLVPRWIYQSGIVGPFQATPIVVDGVMYVSL